MNQTKIVTLTALLLVLFTNGACAQAPPAVYQAKACKVAPRVDGIETPGEWEGAARFEFDLRMRSGKGEERAVRHAELRLMSSSVNLYLALRVPDATRDMTTSPLVADLVILAFCRG